MTKEIKIGALNGADENILDVPVTQAGQVEVEQPQEQPVDPTNLLNLEDVAYMVMVGRTKDGDTFFRTAGVNDLLVIAGLLQFANKEVEFNMEKFLFEREQAKRIQAQQAAQAEAQQAE